MPSNFDGDAFISYAHLDNLELVEGRKGWVANLHRALEIRIAQLLGKQSRIWWDPKLHGNDYFADALVERLRRVAALVSVVSPRYVRSEWARKEIDEFCRAAEGQGGIRVGEKSRLFKVLKTPVPLDDHPSELRNFLGYEFFKVDPETGRAREFYEVFGPEAERDFWITLDDLAHDICCLLEMLEPGQQTGPAASDGHAVYLAVATADVRDAREAIKRDLEQHGYRVLPDCRLPETAAEVETAIRDDLARCRMSIHIVGRTYSLVPEGGVKSLLEIQNDLAIERSAHGVFSRLIWLRPGLQIEDERQRTIVDHLRVDPRIARDTDVLETPLEDLRTMIARRLKAGGRHARPDAGGSAASAGSGQLYLIYDQRDAGVIGPWADFLFEEFEVIHPVFDGDQADIRDYHEENLRTCDAALIFYGAGNECWLRRKLREIQKSAGYGRTRPMRAVGICLIAPRTPEKERFQTHQAFVIPQWDGLSPDPFHPFVCRLRDDGDAHRGEAARPA